MTNTIKIETVTITPERAADLLGRNTHNRKISQVNLSRIKHSLIRGEWKLNGEAIKIARDGTVLDGQHRLVACVETGISFETIFITGLDPDTQDTMDTGKSRTLANAMGLAGYPGSVSLAATVAGVIRLEQYGMKAALRSYSAYPVSTTEAMDRLRSEPTLEDVARDTQKFGRVGLAGRLASVLSYEFSKLDGQDSQFFFDKLYAGDGMERGNPILTLRNALLDAKLNKKGTRDPSYTGALVIKAWNKFRAGESAALLKMTLGGANPESFPEAQ